MTIHYKPMRKTPPIHKAVQKNIYKQIPKGEGFLSFGSFIKNFLTDVMFHQQSTI